MRTSQRKNERRQKRKSPTEATGIIFYMGSYPLNIVSRNHCIHECFRIIGLNPLTVFNSFRFDGEADTIMSITKKHRALQRARALAATGDRTAANDAHTTIQNLRIVCH